MPTIEDFVSLAPFSLEELVSAANAILRERPALQIQARTVRFYISNGLLPPPNGGPKYARYEVEHLRRVVAIRGWLDQGISLDQAADRIKLGEHGGDTKTRPRKDRTRASEYAYVPPAAAVGAPDRIVRRLRLSEHCVLELDVEADLLETLKLAADGILREIEKFTDTA